MRNRALHKHYCNIDEIWSTGGPILEPLITVLNKIMFLLNFQTTNDDYENTDVEEIIDNDEEEDDLYQQSAISYKVPPVVRKQKTAAKILKKSKAKTSKKGEGSFDKQLNAKSSKSSNVAGKTQESPKRSKSKKEEHVQKTLRKSVRTQPNSVHEMRQEIMLEDQLIPKRQEELKKSRRGRRRKEPAASEKADSSSCPLR